MLPGIRREAFRRPRIMTTVAAARSVAAPEAVFAEDTSTFMRSRKSPGSVDVVRPKKSRICVLAISTPMPFVNPMTTGRGMNLTAVPRPVKPRTMRMTPAMSVHMNRPSSPWVATIPATTTTKAPVGPPI